jgi:hypothetical protein
MIRELAGYATKIVRNLTASHTQRRADVTAQASRVPSQDVLQRVLL